MGGVGGKVKLFPWSLDSSAGWQITRTFLRTTPPALFPQPAVSSSLLPTSAPPAPLALCFQPGDLALAVSDQHPLPPIVGKWSRWKNEGDVLLSSDEPEVLADAGTCTSRGVPPPGNQPPPNETLCLLCARASQTRQEIRTRARIQEACAPVLALSLEYGEICCQRLSFLLCQIGVWCR